jgi:murein DD-endopeptidase MepM/ murein hydrolase activator NlpD
MSRGGKPHNGVDFVTRNGDDVIAAGDGVLKLIYKSGRHGGDTGNAG